MKRLVILLSCFLLCCGERPPGELKLYDFGNFSLEGQGSWEIKKENGIDSYVGKIFLGANAEARFDYGYYSNNLGLIPKTYEQISLKELYIKNGIDTSNFIFVDDPRKFDYNRLPQHNILYEKISGYYAKIIYPVRPGKGITGIYFDSLDYNDTLGKMKLSIYAENLNLSNQEEFLKAFRTIRIKQKLK